MSGAGTSGGPLRHRPTIFAAIADGRLNLTAVLMLAPHLTDDNVGELVAAATHRSRAEIALLRDLYPRLAPVSTHRS